MRALLDINVLLALFDADHIDHRRASDWLTREMADGWASCALTQNGFVRIISQPRYPSPITPFEAISRLRRAAATEHHEFWPCSVCLVDPAKIRPDRVYGPRQVTDAYLLALATEHGGRFVTFDHAIPVEAVPAARPENLVVL